MESTYEMRRRAPLHYQARADNARFAAFLLANASEAEVAKAKEASGYGGTPSIGLYEAFRREAALAVELMLKAIVALRIERGISTRGLTKLPLTHDVQALWRDAELPPLSKERRLELLFLKQVLTWAGRYPAPVSDKAAFHEENEIEAARGDDPPSSDGFRLRKLRVFGWEEFADLYEIVATEFWKLHEISRRIYPRPER
jgi:hypothetical protein